MKLRQRRAVVGSLAIALAAVTVEAGRAREGRAFPPVPVGAEREAVARRNLVDPGRVWLRAAVFDPLTEGEPRLEELIPDGAPLRAGAADGAGAYLLQVHPAPDAALRARLHVLGARIHGYVPNRTWIVWLPDGEALDAIRTGQATRWLGRLRPGYKLSPELHRLISEGADGITEIDVVLLPNEAPEALADAVRERFEEVEVEFVRAGDSPRVVLRVPPRGLAPVVAALIRDRAVLFVDRLLPLVLFNDNLVWVGQSYDRVHGPAEAQASDPKPYALSATVWNHGLTGAGQVVAVADTGLEYGMCFFEDPGEPVTPQTVTPPGALSASASHRKIVALNGTSGNALLVDGSFRHGTHVSATVVGDDLAHLAGGASAGHDHGDGVAPGARVVFEDVGAVPSSSCSALIGVSSLGALLEQEYGAGARIATNSWGSGTGVYTSGAAEVDAFVWEHHDMLVLFAAGNDGAAGVSNLGSCKNCIAVGACENYDGSFQDVFGILDPENMAAFSSRGPAADGRVKPDLVAPGYRVDSARFPVQYFFDDQDPACDPGDPEVCFPSFGGCYLTDPSATCSVEPLNGTSMASPAAAGFAALARQYFTEGFYPSGTATPADARVPSAALLKAVLLNGARNMTGRLYERRGTPADFGPLADAPSAVQGWGRVMLDDALYFAGDARGVRLLELPDPSGVATGDDRETRFRVTAGGQRLKITVVWTDPPGSVIAGAALVNDLDLEVTAPDGTTYRGNQWTADDINLPGDKLSEADPAGRDAINNVEAVHVASPMPGEWRARVEGREVPGHDGTTTQGFALVISGEVSDAAPPPVPDGTTGAGMTASRAVPDGTEIDLTWDASSCPAAGYHLLYGALTGVGSAAIAGAVCDLGGSGSYAWAGVPGDDLWFVVVAGDGLDLEGSWGQVTGGGHRGDASPSGVCGYTRRDNSGTCDAP
jgi:hypothetical protein